MPEAPVVNATVLALSFAVYTLFIIGVGIYSARYAQRGDEDYFLAGRSLGGWMAALSASASSESGWVTMGLVGIGFAAGVQGYWVIPGCLLGYVFNWFFLAGRLSDSARQLGALTVPDFLSHRFGERIPLIRGLAVVVILAAMLAYVAAQMAAAGKAFGYILDLTDVGSALTPGAEFGQARGYQFGVLIGAAVVLLYTVGGGFRAVCWTDFLQALLMVAALVVFPVYLLVAHGGFGFIAETLRNVGDPAAGLPAGHLLDPFGGHAGWALLGFLLGSHALGINFGYPGQPHVLVRFMALKDRRQAKLAGVVAVVWGLCVYWGAVTAGLFARAMTEQGAEWGGTIRADSELSLVVASAHLLPAVLSGLVLAAVLAAICSTADSQLVVAASSAAYDFYTRLVRRGAQGGSIWVNRLTVLGLGIGAVLMVIDQRVKVYQYVLQYGWAMLGASFGPQVILGVMWRRASYAGCFAGMLAGFVLAIGWANWYDASATGVEIYNLPLAFTAALGVNVLVSLLIPDRTPSSTAIGGTGP